MADSQLLCCFLFGQCRKLLLLPHQAAAWLTEVGQDLGACGFLALTAPF